MNDYTAWYAQTETGAPSAAADATVFKREFQADDLQHAADQAADAQEDGEYLLGVRAE